MHLTSVYIRFYKSFNFDYLRKYDPKAKERPWDRMDGMWYPYVMIPIDRHITTVVGANESGKSHLLGAIRKGISGSDLARGDFCRHSQYFTVETDRMKLPDFGFEWSGLSNAEQGWLRDTCAIPGTSELERFWMFRNDGSRVSLYLSNDASGTAHALDEEQAENLIAGLPHVFEIDAEIALPDAVPISALSTSDSASRPHLRPAQRNSLVSQLLDLRGNFTDAQSVIANAESIQAALAPLLPSGGSRPSLDAEKQLDLARDLMLQVARIDPRAFGDLNDALQSGATGHALGIVQEINSRLASSLNFPKWWAQDRDFQLVVTVRDTELAFTIRDRTGTDYSFSERSRGLKYFLSYHIQHLAHDYRSDVSEILLMDEPDSYLSSEGQQDLLRIFSDFAGESAGHPPVQVIYVTHSPFLIDKNHAERVRVLEKGIGEEGTRVVKNAARNHYEPLRSAFGPQVGETTFIGTSNLIVEGPADQILICGMAAHLTRRGVPEGDTLDLNAITVVPAGGASNVPYMVYLARGRDSDKPAVIVLLDSDQGGQEAKRRLQKSVVGGKQILAPRYIYEIANLRRVSASVMPRQVTLPEIEDLIPVPICVDALKSYLGAVADAGDDVLARITDNDLSTRIATGMATFASIEAVVEALDADLHVDKVGFARSVIDVVAGTEVSPANRRLAQAVEKYRANMIILCREVNRLRMMAQKERLEERVSRKLDRVRRAFLRDHPHGAHKEHALSLLADLEGTLDDSPESAVVRSGLRLIRSEFNLEIDVVDPIPDYSKFQQRLEHIQYSGEIAGLPVDARSSE